MDVSYQVSQYQTIITELKGEITRLNTKLGSDADSGKSVSRNSAKTRDLKKQLISTFRWGDTITSVHLFVIYSIFFIY